MVSVCQGPCNSLTMAARNFHMFPQELDGVAPPIRLYRGSSRVGPYICSGASMPSTESPRRSVRAVEVAQRESLIA